MLGLLLLRLPQMIFIFYGCFDPDIFVMTRLGLAVEIVYTFQQAVAGVTELCEELKECGRIDVGNWYALPFFGTSTK